MNSCNKTLTILLLFLSLLGKSQNYFDPISQEYLLEHPAFFLTDKNYHVSLYKLKQWGQFNNGNTISLQKAINYDRINLGVVFHNNSYFKEFKQSRVEVPISYQINLGDGKLSFGLAAGIKNEVVNYDELYTPQKNDPLFASQISWAPTFSSGFYYRDAKTDVGISMIDLLNSSLINSSPQFSMLLGRTIELSNRFKLQSVVKTRIRAKTPIAVVWRNTLELDHKMSLSLVVGLDKEVAISTGLNLKNIVRGLSQDLRISYAYSRQLSELRVLGATHQVGLNYLWNKRPSIEKIKRREKLHSPILFD